MLKSFKIGIFNEKLDQSSQIRNFNMQLYPKNAKLQCEPIPHTNFGPKSSMLQKVKKHSHTILAVDCLLIVCCLLSICLSICQANLSRLERRIHRQALPARRPSDAMSQSGATGNRRWAVGSSQQAVGSRQWTVGNRQ